MTAFDISSIDLKADSERGSWLHLKDPRTGKPINTKDGDPVRLRVLGPQADAVTQATEAANKERQEREAKRAEFDSAGKLVKAGTSTKEELVADDVRIYTAATVGWENMAFNGVETFSKDIIASLYAERDWARAQVFRWMLDYANFMPGQESA